MKNILITISLMTAFFLFACGESSSDQSSTNEDGIVTSRIINENNTLGEKIRYDEARLKVIEFNQRKNEK